MGTRGAFGFQLGEDKKVIYNHSDSYFEGLGQDVINFCKQKLDIKTLKDHVKKLTPMTQEEENSVIDVKSGPSYFDSPEEFLEATNMGIVPKYPCAKKFLEDGLFCEYAYIVNLDDKSLDIYTSGNYFHSFSLGEIPNNWLEILKNKKEEAFSSKSSVRPKSLVSRKKTSKRKTTKSPSKSYGTATLLVDTSGSIEKKDFEGFLSEIEKIFRAKGMSTELTEMLLPPKAKKKASKTKK